MYCLVRGRFRVVVGWESAFCATLGDLVLIPCWDLEIWSSSVRVEQHPVVVCNFLAKARKFLACPLVIIRERAG